MQDAPTDPNDAALVETILAVKGKGTCIWRSSRKGRTIEQIDFLKKHGCRLFQGYLRQTAARCGVYPSHSVSETGRSGGSAVAASLRFMRNMPRGIISPRPEYATWHNFTRNMAILDRLMGYQGNPPAWTPPSPQFLTIAIFWSIGAKPMVRNALLINCF